MVNIARNLLIMLNNLQQMHLKLLQKEQFIKQLKQRAIWLVIKLLIKSQKFQQRHNKILKRQLQMTIIKKYQKKDKYLRDKGKKLLMKLD